ncbi:MAG TPA: esterase, partial [Deltaproteobacteria bacterium]|nr:esterase [Deltaproteobacteria bacterium]
MLYQNFTKQEQIDQEYNPRLRVEQTNQYLQKYLSESERVRNKLKHQDGIPYGPSLAEILDFYPAKRKNSPLLCFIHG